MRKVGVLVVIHRVFNPGYVSLAKQELTKMRPVWSCHENHPTLYSRNARRGTWWQVSDVARTHVQR